MGATEPVRWLKSQLLLWRPLVPQPAVVNSVFPWLCYLTFPRWKSIPPLGLPTAHKSITVFYGLNTGWSISCPCRSLPGAEMKDCLSSSPFLPSPRCLGSAQGQLGVMGTKGSMRAGLFPGSQVTWQVLGDTEHKNPIFPRGAALDSEFVCGVAPIGNICQF